MRLTANCRPTRLLLASFIPVLMLLAICATSEASILSSVDLTSGFIATGDARMQVSLTPDSVTLATIDHDPLTETGLFAHLIGPLPTIPANATYLLFDADFYNRFQNLGGGFIELTTAPSIVFPSGTFPISEDFVIISTNFSGTKAFNLSQFRGVDTALIIHFAPDQMSQNGNVIETLSSFRIVDDLIVPADWLQDELPESVRSVPERASIANWSLLGLVGAAIGYRCRKAGHFFKFS